jgi:prolipoprotein diacylglyceryltransferase
MGYAVIRFPLDFLRAEDIDPRFAGLTVAQWGCFSLFAIGAAALALGRSVQGRDRRG